MKSSSNLCVYFFILTQVCLLANCKFAKEFFKFSNNNLTQLIQKVLLEQNEDHIAEIKEALKRSPFVYYETDILLSQIDQLLPVVDLLDILSDQKHPQPKLLISLRYVNQTSGNFLQNRLDEILRDPQINTSSPDQKKITTRVAAFLLDFYSANTHIYDNKDMINIVWNRFGKISFPTWVKKTLQLQFGESYVPQVGVRFGRHQLDIYYQEMANADFVNLVMDAVNDFPNRVDPFIDLLKDELKKVNAWTNAVYLTVTDSIKGNQPSNESIFQSSWNIPSSEWFKFKVIRTTNCINISQHLIQSAREKALKVFTKLLCKLQENRVASFVARACNENEEEGFKRESFIIPHVHEFAPSPAADTCELNRKLASWKSNYENIIMDEVAWAEMNSFHWRIYINESSSWCPENPDQAAAPPPLNVLINVFEGFKKYWTDSEDDLQILIYGHFPFAGIRAETILFSEDDIRESKEIQAFLIAGKSKHYKIGCVVSFGLLVPKSFCTFFKSETFRNRLESRICAPLFQLVDTFVWKVEKEYLDVPTTGLFSRSTGVFLTREIFMQEFPRRNVIIQFTDSFIGEPLAQVYNVPIAFPHDSLLFKPEKRKFTLNGTQQRSEGSKVTNAVTSYVLCFWFQAALTLV